MEYSVKVSSPQCIRLGTLLRELDIQTEDLFNPQLYPSKDAEIEDTLRFFFFVTGIDHRTSPPGQSFEGTIDGEYFQGADLLWHLSLLRFNEDASYFHPKYMAKITSQRIREWFTVIQPSRVTIRNPAQRAALLRDAGTRLMRKYRGGVQNLLEKTNHQVSSDSTEAPGLLQLLSEFQAYADPAHKKSYLLLKFLVRRGLWVHSDSDHIRIPVDNHLTRIALRTGIITVPYTLATLLQHQTPLGLEMDIRLRNAVSDAYLKVSTASSHLVLDLDDFFWHFGRNCCLHDNPVCVSGCKAHCFVSKSLLRNGCSKNCPLGTVCLAYDDDAQRALVEPKIETWYY